MTLDVRSRRVTTRRTIERDELLDELLPRSLDAHGDLVVRGADVLGVPPLGLDVDGLSVTVVTASGRASLQSGVTRAGVVAALDAEALSDFVQDAVSSIGLAMTSRVKITRGNVNQWVRWEPVLRAMVDGRKVHEPGDVTFVDPDGHPLDLSRSFTADSDRDEVAHFLDQAGFLRLRGVFDESEMDAVRIDVDEWIARATPDDGESWWAQTGDGRAQAVRVLNFQEKSASAASLLGDPRFTWIADLTGDGHRPTGMAEGLVKPLDIVRGLSDLPWHKDCGQGGHTYSCNSLTCGISVTGADRISGALGVVPGSHRANTLSSGLDRSLDLQPMLLETDTGDMTVHCSDTLHRAHPPVERPRTVVYSSFALPPLGADGADGADGDRPIDVAAARRRRAELCDVQRRIEAADNEHSAGRYRAGHGR